MDFRSLCQKIDVDSLKAKLPPMPSISGMHHLKMPKLRARKIFRSSREDVSAKSSSMSPKLRQSQRSASQPPPPSCPPPPIPRSQFVRHTPTRISTIASLMDQDEGAGDDDDDDDVGDYGARLGDYNRRRPASLVNATNTYRSACSIDEDYPSPRHFDRLGSRPISPVRTTNLHCSPDTASATTKRSLSQRVQQGYKDLSEFRLKHIFAKKTVVRRDAIVVASYVSSFEEDRRREEERQQRRDHRIADNYRFKFKEARQGSGHSNSFSSPEHSPETRTGRRTGRGLSELSGDESGMETSPPQRKAGIAATRFAKVRNPPLRQSSSDEYEGEGSRVRPNPSSLWSIKENRTPVEASPYLVSRREKIKALGSQKKPQAPEGRPQAPERRPPAPERRSQVSEKRPQVSEKRPQAPEKTTQSDEKRSQGSEKKDPKKSYIRRLASMGSSYETAGETPGDGATTTRSKVFAKLRNIGKRGSGHETDEDPDVDEKANSSATKSLYIAGEKAKAAVKYNIKRIQQSMKRPQTQAQTHATDESEDEDGAGGKPTKSLSKREKLAARLRRFKSHDDITTTKKSSAGETDEELEEREEAENAPTVKSPLHSVISTKIQAAWKKSFKKRSPEHVGDAKAHTDDETTPEKRSRSDTLIKKLRYMRGGKNATSLEVEPDAEDEPKKASVNLEEKFVQARQRTLKKVNETMQHMKFFNKSQEQLDADAKKEAKAEEAGEGVTKGSTKAKKPPKRPKAPPAVVVRPDDECDEEEMDMDMDIDMEEIKRTCSAQNVRTSWTTRSLLSESAGSSMDMDSADFPRVLIHQDNSDAYESTLIIAVTRGSLSRSKSNSPIITEITAADQEEPEEEEPLAAEEVQTPTKSVDWITSSEIITGFLAMEPPAVVLERRLSASEYHDAFDRALPRCLSDLNVKVKDVSDEVPVKGEALRKPFETVENLANIEDQEKSWKIKGQSSVMLYKTKSIDIFERNAKTGGAMKAFDDFDDALRNEPVVKIAASDDVDDSIDKDSSEDPDGPDDDNTSRITKILANPLQTPERVARSVTPQKTNSLDSTAVNYDETEPIYEQEESDDDDDDFELDRPPSSAPSPPPAMLPPPPPLPQRKASLLIHKSSEETAELPPLPKSRPPPMPTAAAVPLPTIPARTASMTRTTKPLVKTASLRLAYCEQVNPSDVGKVNKLISRFEQPGGAAATTTTAPTASTTATTKTHRRPRIIPRNRHQYDEDDYSEDDGDEGEEEEDDDDDAAEDAVNANRRGKRDMTPTPTNSQKPAKPTTTIVDAAKGSRNPLIERQSPSPVKRTHSTSATSTNSTTTSNNNNTNAREVGRTGSKLSLNFDRNSNCSLPNSEYGSPLEYPSSLIGSTETTPVPERRADNLQVGSRNSRRSMTLEQRHEERFLSFDSDEENSYYSISSTGSSRYVVEI